jgi:hypothetical protein
MRKFRTMEKIRDVHSKKYNVGNKGSTLKYQINGTK